MVNLWGRPWARHELLARVGRLDQVAGVQLVQAGADAIDACADRIRRAPPAEEEEHV